MSFIIIFSVCIQNFNTTENLFTHYFLTVENMLYCPFNDVTALNFEATNLIVDKIR